MIVGYWQTCSYPRYCPKSCLVLLIGGCRHAFNVDGATVPVFASIVFDTDGARMEERCAHGLAVVPEEGCDVRGLCSASSDKPHADERGRADAEGITQLAVSSAGTLLLVLNDEAGGATETTKLPNRSVTACNVRATEEDSDMLSDGFGDGDQRKG